VTAELRAELRARLLGLVDAAAELEGDAAGIARLTREALDALDDTGDPRRAAERLNQAAQLLALVELPELDAMMEAARVAAAEMEGGT